LEAPNHFFEKPVLKGPCDQPARHWELGPSGQPTQRILPARRRAEFITPIPTPRKRKGQGQGEQGTLALRQDDGLSTAAQQYDPTSIINDLRGQVDAWRTSPNPNDWLARPETARLLQHWRHHKFNEVKPIFCQMESVETVIQRTDIASERGNGMRHFGERVVSRD